MKRFIQMFFVLLVVLYCMMLTLNYLILQLGNKSQKDAIILIEQGSSIRSVSLILVENSAIKNPILFKFLAKYSAYRGRYIQSGEYEIKAGEDVFQILNQLLKGNRYVRKLVIPEGYTAYQVLAEIKAAYGIIADMNDAIEVEEGALYPDTYYYYYGDKASKLLEMMHKKMAAVIAANPMPANHPLKSYKEVITLASIVEKETSVTNERRIVASVYLNRLKRGMILQADPTVIYGLYNGKTDFNYKLTKDDLKKDTPYNTYTRAGLPPSPIASVGVAAIEAVLNPADTDYIYFVAIGDGSGGHNFATNLAGHNANVRDFRAVKNK